ncbi:FAD/NAD(P)-binding domain-containing protein [Macrolepiota fuliginosa MF-IS2]|uniref:FAD/NAD(P)-binding domain-containing protein n=1 Tax=Macrolepiota fuliginosa MF-IS2 TaxID=1400762 RepID=A0A9P5X5T4_9AGAR|nr:FAD/NAD(P)-binding domain-containing protein [Macrolepiota fuliginosa MF-IS2]
MTTNSITAFYPSNTTILVIGGGPSGSYAASALAREGFDTTLIEAAKFPRYHIGESMLPSLIPFSRFIEVEDKLRAANHALKRGAAVKFNQHKQEGYTDFVRGDERNASFNVIRSEFDEMLLRHAEESGAKVFEETKVAELRFVDPKAAELRPTSAVWTRANGETGEIKFEYLVDASGRNGIMSTKYLKNRKMNQTLHNLACWGYWTEAGVYKPGTEREGAPWFEALTDESGWGWFIPLKGDKVSVGIVMDSSISAKKKADGRKASPTGEHSLKDHYLEQIKLVPTLKKFLENANLKEDADHTIRSAADFSYAADRYAGDHYRLVGDASAFIDPFFSSGVHLALLGGLTSATSIAASIRGHCTEKEAWEFHDVKVATAYTRFLLVVMSAYKQIRNQNKTILADVDEVSFDRAFDILRPVIQGTADVGKKLTSDELEKTMEFCKDVFAPTDPEMIEAVGARLRPELLAPNAPIMSDEDIKKEAQGDEEIETVLHRVNARKPVNQLYQGPSNLQADDVNGLVARLVHGQLGLVRV